MMTTAKTLISLGMLAIALQGQVASGVSAKGRYIRSTAHQGILQDGDEICLIIIEPTEGKFLGLFSPKMQDCFVRGETNDSKLDKTLRGSVVSASGLEKLSEDEEAFIEEASKFYNVPRKTEFLRLTKSYKVEGSIVRGKLKSYSCKDVASEGIEVVFESLEVNASAMTLRENASEKPVMGVPDSTYRRSQPDLRRFLFGRVSDCPYDLNVTIQEAAFEGKVPVDVRASCPGGDTPAWVKLRCTPE